MLGVAVGVSAWLTAGALIGAVYFLTLHWNVRRFVDEPSLLSPLGVQIVRLALIATTLTIVAKSFGALALVAATAGIVAARTAVIRGDLPP